MTELKLGKVKLCELAEWFGISAGAMRNGKAKKLEILKAFARYHVENNSIYIDEIYIPVYSKAYEVIKTHLPTTWHANGIDTSARVGAEIYCKHKEVSAQIGMETAKSYANRAKVEFYGHNYLDDRGTLGSSEYVWCRIQGQETEPLTQEQYDIIKECSKEAYSEVSEKIVLLHDAYSKGEITKQELEMGLGNTIELRQDCLVNFYKLLKEKLGFVPDRATKIYNERWFDAAT